MRARWLVIWLTVSVVLNVVLLAAWLSALRPAAAPLRTVARRPIITNLLRPIRTNLVFQPRLLSWKDIESEDYPSYVRNLRGIGCPPETVRDIIVADVNALFARRREGEGPSLAQQWWRSEPDPELALQAAAKQAELETERRSLLTTLLGPNWEGGSLAIAAGGQETDLDGPVLGSLSDQARQQVRSLERLSRERLESLKSEAATQGKVLSETELARWSREARDELAAVLSPEQLEEYLLRHSPTAERLRKQFRGLSLTPEEFRNLFRATDTAEAQRAELGEATDPVSEKRRAELAKALDRAFEHELGAARYLRNQLNQDAVFQDTRTAVERAGVGAEKLIPLYQVNQVSLKERQRVLGDRTLTPDEQTRLLAELYEQRLATLRQLVGEEAFQKLQADEQP